MELVTTNLNGDHAMKNAATMTKEQEGSMELEKFRIQMQLNAEEWNKVAQKGMEACGYLDGEKIISIVHHQPIMK